MGCLGEPHGVSCCSSDASLFRTERNGGGNVPSTVTQRGVYDPRRPAGVRCRYVKQILTTLLNSRGLWQGVQGRAQRLLRRTPAPDSPGKWPARLRPASMEEWGYLAGHSVSLPRFAGRAVLTGET
jgi:hypothetical protein